MTDAEHRSPWPTCPKCGSGTLLSIGSDLWECGMCHNDSTTSQIKASQRGTVPPLAAEPAALTAQEAEVTLRIMELENGIEQAQFTIQFLVDCLNGDATHAYPEQTQRRLEKLKALHAPLPLCHHSKWMPDCVACQTRHQRLETIARLRATAPAGKP